MLLLTTVSRGVDIVNLTVDDFDTSFRNDVNQLVDASSISRDWARREDNGIAGLKLHLTVSSVGDTRGLPSAHPDYLYRGLESRLQGSL